MGKQVIHNSGNNEWYTPVEYIEAARNCMGTIDLDPASSDKANEIVCASMYYTKEDNGLDKPWHGNVWLNPPYARKLIDQFADKIITEIDNYKVKQMCVLVNNETETKWFQKLSNYADAICLIKGRIRFINGNGTDNNSPLKGQIMLYFGSDVKSFEKYFFQFGAIYE